MPMVEGVTIAGYRIESVAGRGGMGVVYRAQQIGLDRAVALKVIAPELAAGPTFRARFVRESRIAASLDHPNVIPVYEAREDEGRLFIAMRLVEGTDLARLIRDQGPLPPWLAAHIVSQAAAALDAAHARGLVHRDVKPANLLLAGDPTAPHVYLTDFGLAKREDSSAALTSADAWIGTPDYAAPEQVEGDEVDARTDVYALGCVLFAALTGRPPFGHGGALAKAWAHVHEPPPALRDVAPGVPAGFEAVIGRALAKRPAERFRTAGELGAAARAAAREEVPTRVRADSSATHDLGAEGGTHATARLVRALSAPRRRLALAVAASLTLLAAAAVVAALSGLFSSAERPAASSRSTHAPAARSAARPAPPAASASAGTVRCSGSACEQARANVSPPIEGSACNQGSQSGSWTRIDNGAREPLLACIAGQPRQQPRASAVGVPDLAGARLDLAERVLDRLGVAHDTSGGGVFGVVVDSNWTVCVSRPQAGADLPPGATLKLFVDRSC